MEITSRAVFDFISNHFEISLFFFKTAVPSANLSSFTLIPSIFRVLSISSATSLNALYMLALKSVGGNAHPYLSLFLIKMFLGCFHSL